MLKKGSIKAFQHMARTNGITYTGSTTRGAFCGLRIKMQYVLVSSSRYELFMQVGHKKTLRERIYTDDMFQLICKTIADHSRKPRKGNAGCRTINTK